MNKSFRLIVVGLFAFALIASGQNVLYGVTGVSGAASSLYTVNISTGVATLVGATGFNGVGSLAFAPNGTTLFGVANASSRTLITINTTTGVGTARGATGATFNIADIAFRADGVLFGVDGGSRLYTINTTTGAATLVGSLSSGSPVGGGLAFNAAGTLFLVDGSNLLTVNTSNAVATSVGTLNFAAFPAGADRVAGMKFHPTTGALFGTVFLNSDPASSARIGSSNTTSGTVNLVNVGNPGVVLEALAFGGPQQTPPPGVPVPSSLLLLGTGLVAAMFWSYRRRRSAVI